MVDDAEFGFTLYVDEFRDAAIPSRDFDNILCQVTKTWIETPGDFPFHPR